MYKEYQYMRITYLIGIYLTFSYIFGIASLTPTIEIIHDLLTLTCCLTAYMWTKKNVILIGLAVYWLSFNFELLYSPVFSNSGTWTIGSISFFLRLELIATILVIAGLADSYFGDKYLNYKSNLKLTPIATFLVVGTITLQLIIRIFG